MNLDPITLVLVQNRLDYIARQMGWVMTRTARSPIFSFAHDFSCFITDARGYIVSQSDGLPIHSGGGGFAVRALLEVYGTDIYEGDAFLLSDPYVAGGNHLPDWVIARPVFVSGKVVAFCCNRAHQSDIGGGAPGTYNSAATDIFQEGLRLPPVRLVDKDKPNSDLLRLVLLNSRAPELMDGDLRAMLGSTRIGTEQTKELISSLDENEGVAYLEGILDVGERRMRAAIAEIPDGVYFGEDATDNDCFGPRRYAIRIKMAIVGDRLTIDFTGTDPQMKGFKNSSIANTHSAVYVGVASFLEPTLPKNEGTFRAISIIAPKGSLVNPNPPAPMTMNTICPATEIIHAVWMAFGQALPARSCAGWGKNSVPIMAGRQADGAQYFMYHWGGAIGGGAVDGRDGFNANGALNALGALVLPDLELYEQNYPVRFLHQEFRTDSAGPGKYRGGTGLDYAVEVDSPTTLSLRGEGVRTPSSFGAAGGRAGVKAELKLEFLDGTSMEPPQYGVINVKPMRLHLSAAAGGGWGNPFERDPELVLRDVRDEVVSVEAGRAQYGVVVDTATWSVDQRATNDLRAVSRT